MSELKKQIIVGVVVAVLVAGASGAASLWNQQPVTAAMIAQIQADQAKQAARMDAIERKAADDHEAFARSIDQLRSDVRDVGTNVDWIRRNMEARK